MVQFLPRIFRKRSSWHLGSKGVSTQESGERGGREGARGAGGTAWGGPICAFFFEVAFCGFKSTSRKAQCFGCQKGHPLNLTRKLTCQFERHARDEVLMKLFSHAMKSMSASSCGHWLPDNLGSFRCATGRPCMACGMGQSNLCCSWHVFFGLWVLFIVCNRKLAMFGGSPI